MGFFIRDEHLKSLLLKTLIFFAITIITIVCSSLIIRLVFPPIAILAYTPFSTITLENNIPKISLTDDDKLRIYTPLSQVSPFLIKSTLLQEDQYFYWHPGINPIALITGVYQTYIKKSRRVGASTITMQVARMVYGIHSKTVPGKFKQILLALQLELFYSKKMILEAYLNLAPYGSNIEGIAAASLIYFNKSPANLSQLEAIVLSVIPQNPIRRFPETIENQQELLKASQRLLSRTNWDSRNAIQSENLLLTIEEMTKNSDHFSGSKYLSPEVLN